MASKKLSKFSQNDDFAVALAVHLVPFQLQSKINHASFIHDSTSIFMETHDILAELEWRGLVHQMTNETNLAVWLREKPRTVYAGFDPTAASLHVGHLVALMNLRRFQQFGHRPIVVAGGATATIGDPSGKNEERNLLSKEIVEQNVRSIESQIKKFLRFDDSSSGAILVNNFDWLSKFSYIDFLRDVGKHFPVSMMLAKDSVKMRLEQSESGGAASGLSFTEFSYMLMQSYDFVHLHRNFGCELQIGGSDQWGNITLGCEFGRRVGGYVMNGLTSPLLTKSDGKKMGKTEAGALWLDPNRTSPYQFYQYWMNLDDSDVEKTLKIFTELQHSEITQIMTEHQNDRGKRTAQKCLAGELTRLVHGDEGVRTAQKATEIFFGGQISELNDAELNSIFADVQSKEISRDRLVSGLSLIDALCESGLAKSKGDARRTIEQGGASINNISQPREIHTILGVDHLASETIMVVRTGKKNYALLKFV
ncbi:MAG: tyrosine--tRNA ligase [Thermoguttaceae bacterium]